METETLAMSNDTAPAEDTPQYAKEKEIDDDEDKDDIDIDVDVESLPFRLHEAERFITFTDAVVAIAMTLLILPLMDAAEELGDDGGDPSFSDYFSENGNKIGAFFLSFLVIKEQWIFHEHMTRYVGCFTRPMVWLNFIWMLGIVCFPIGGVVVIVGSGPLRYVVFIVPLLVSKLTGTLMCVVMTRDKRTLKGNKCPGALMFIDCGIHVCLLVIALLLAIFVPKIKFYSLIIIFTKKSIMRAIHYMFPKLKHVQYVQKDNDSDDNDDDEDDDDDDDEDDEALSSDLHEAERFITFTDAAVAIAITLLILPLMDAASELGDDGEESSVSDYFGENGNKMGALLTSFFIIAYVWTLHDNMTRYIGCFTSAMVWLNFYWILGVIWIPIGTALIYSIPDPIALTVYLVPIVVSALASFLMCALTRHDKRTLKGKKRPGILFLIGSGVHACLLVIALLLVMFFGVSYYIMYILLLRKTITKVIGRMFPSLTHEQYAQ